MFKDTAKRVVEAMATQQALTPVMSRVLRVSAHALLAQNMPVLSFNYPHRLKAAKLIKQVQAETDTQLRMHEAYTIFSTVQQTAKVPGDIAEVGVYQGGSAKLICEAKGTRHLHLFDTFEGLPPQQRDIDAAHFSKGNYACALKTVRQYLKSYREVSFYKGLFPDSAGPVSDRKFSFVHLDVDLYESTRDSLKFFYSRMSAGGVIVSHDYFWPGVKAAFDEFFADKPEPVLELAGNQCMVMRTA